MKVKFYGTEKEVYEIVKKGGRHKYYTIFDKEEVGVCDEDTDEIRPIQFGHEEFVKEIRVNFNAKDSFKIEELQ